MQEEACACTCSVSDASGVTEVASPDPGIISLRTKFDDVFAKPGLPLIRDIARDITLKEEGLVPPKPRVYCMLPAELTEV